MVESWRKFGEELRGFGVAAGAIAGLGGFYLGAVAVDAEWFFVVGIGLAAGFGFRHRLLWVPRALRGYQPLLERVAELEERTQNAEEVAKRLPVREFVAYRSGLHEGRAQMTGAYLSRLAREMPELTAVTAGNGQLTLIGRVGPDSKLQVGARLRLVVAETGEIKGAVQAMKVNSDGRVEMAPVEQTVPEFWRALEQRAVTDSSLPPGVSLSVYDAPVIPGWKEGTL